MWCLFYLLCYNMIKIIHKHFFKCQLRGSSRLLWQFGDLSEQRTQANWRVVRRRQCLHDARHVRRRRPLHWPDDWHWRSVRVSRRRRLRISRAAVRHCQLQHGQVSVRDAPSRLCLSANGRRWLRREFRSIYVYVISCSQ